MKIVSIIGARPQFIKCALLSRELRKFHRDILVHTGQHYDYNMNRIFFDELGIPEPDYNLGIGSGSHGYQTGEMLKKIEEVLVNEKPDLVIVYGDTNTTLAGALAAVKLHTKTAHVESGLRSFDKSMPEEINRILTDHCSDYLFCPTQTAVDNLKKENLISGVYLTGDVMVDVLSNNREIAERSDILDVLKLKSKHYIVLTLHRANNTDLRENLDVLIDVLIRLSETGETIVFPMHPRTRKLLVKYDLFRDLEAKVYIVDPLGYLEFLKLLNHSRKVLTDSGGIQKEAYILKVPCITLRENTEWVETVHDGWNVLVGMNADAIIEAVSDFDPKTKQNDVFGTGACNIIADLLNR
jgi:UDP-GlcNAc3NAcA epimerase